jgi:hypothetical protein
MVTIDSLGFVPQPNLRAIALDQLTNLADSHVVGNKEYCELPDLNNRYKMAILACKKYGILHRFDPHYGPYIHRNQILSDD